MAAVSHKQFVVDQKGKKVAVLLTFPEYEKLLKDAQLAHALKTIRQGEEEYRRGKIKPIRSLSDLD